MRKPDLAEGDNHDFFAALAFFLPDDPRNLYDVLMATSDDVDVDDDGRCGYSDNDLENVDIQRRFKLPPPHTNDYVTALGEGVNCLVATTSPDVNNVDKVTHSVVVATSRNLNN